jgi:hypothetical protein
MFRFALRSFGILRNILKNLRKRQETYENFKAFGSVRLHVSSPGSVQRRSNWHHRHAERSIALRKGCSQEILWSLDLLNRIHLVQREALPGKCLFASSYFTKNPA